MKKKKINYYSIFEEEKFYHIYNRGNNRENIFYEERNYIYFLNQWNSYLSDFLEVYTYCLMPNHFHFLVKVKECDAISQSDSIAKSPYSISKSPSDSIAESDTIALCNDNDTDINKLITEKFRTFFISYSQAINKQQGHTGNLFQKRFKRISVDSNEYITRLMHYIHHNPVHHEFSDNYENWKYSSYRALLCDKPTKVNRSEVLEWFDGKKDFIYFHKMMLNYKKIEDYIIEN